MHVVNPHWVSGTRRRCQAIAVLISLQLCLISSVEANHRTVGELGSPDTGAVEPTWRRAATTSCTFPSLSLSLSLWRLFISRDFLFSFQATPLLNTLPAGSFAPQPNLSPFSPQHVISLLFPSERRLSRDEVWFSVPAFFFPLSASSSYDLLHFPECLSITIDFSPKLVAAAAVGYVCNRG